MLDSSKNFNVREGVLTPSFQMGVRYDGGDAEEGMGLEAGGGVRYVSGGLTLKQRLESFLFMSKINMKNGELEQLLGLIQVNKGRGLSLSIAPTWGTAASNNADRLWSAKELHTLGGSENFKNSEQQLDAELGYGLWRPFLSCKGF